VTVLGSAVIGLTKPKDSFRFIPALMIGEGRLILSKESSNSPTLELRLAGVPGGYRALSKASPASLGLGNGAVRAGVQVEHVQATGASPAKVFALQGSVHWPDRNSASPPPPQWLTGDYANDDPKNRLNKLEDEIKPGVYPLNDELDERLRRLLTRVRDGQSDARAKQLAKQSLTLLGSLR
ncbi:MAG TPA: hypothetical protein VML55_16475, partial [Planctomycetaceae bacterium]|nr:hypothetical protein [Planctomycetaceae bacterium]